MGGRKDPQTHIKELPRAKWVVGQLPLFRAPRTIYVAVANHAVTYAGVQVKSYVSG